MFKIYCCLILGFSLGLGNLLAQTPYTLRGQTLNQSGSPLAEVWLISDCGQDAWSDERGFFTLEISPERPCTLILHLEGYENLTLFFEPSTWPEDSLYSLRLQASEGLPKAYQNLPLIRIEYREGLGGGRHLRAVEGLSINATRKTEVIEMDAMTANLANNTPRQLYAKIAGLNIWENDNSGLQLNIGGRGLNPNRTSNFNTRQNGYDISADALGYPETYYTPPAQALQRIEIIRGAASLQYGTQFGGLLNFVLREGPEDKALQIETEQTLGSFGFFSSFNSIGGTVMKGKLNYYGFYQYRRGQGWRPNSGFSAHNGYAALRYRHKGLKIRLEQSKLQYLAQQAGGMTDAEFALDPRQSKRERNWFWVDWNLSALDLEYRFSEKQAFNARVFGLLAGRESLGNLQPINRPDYGDLRDLIKGRYANIGTELRFLQRYLIAQKFPSTLLVGGRLYRGMTSQQQGWGNAGSGGSREDFRLDPALNQVLRSDYRFPSYNTALFLENYIQLGERWTLTPGFRQEYIYTQAQGSYQELVVAQGAEGLDTLRNRAVPEQRQNGRPVYLGGLGLGYRPTESMELYANFAQNYRGINFNDMRILNPNQEIDPNLRDERGFNADLGFRGQWRQHLRWDFSLFYLAYRERIGNLGLRRPNPENPFLMEPYTLRTNIGDARVMGLESLIEANILPPCLAKADRQALAFINLAWLDGRYLSEANSFAAGKQLEFVAPLTLRTGLNLRYQDLQIAWQYAYTASHFSDASNAEQVANAVVGRIPAYGIMDLSLSYTWRMCRLQAGCNNLGNTMYFSRRAVSYPGPGILPGEGRSFYLGLRYVWGK